MNTKWWINEKQSTNERLNGWINGWMTIEIINIELIKLHKSTNDIMKYNKTVIKGNIN